MDYGLSSSGCGMWGAGWLWTSEHGTYKTVKSRFRTNMAHLRQSMTHIIQSMPYIRRQSHIQDSQCHMQDSQGQILAVAFRQKSLNPVNVFPLRSEADLRVMRVPQRRHFVPARRINFTQRRQLNSNPSTLLETGNFTRSRSGHIKWPVLKNLTQPVRSCFRA